MPLRDFFKKNVKSNLKIQTGIQRIILFLLKDANFWLIRYHFETTQVTFYGIKLLHTNMMLLWKHIFLPLKVILLLCCFYWSINHKNETKVEMKHNIDPTNNAKVSEELHCCLSKQACLTHKQFWFQLL